MHVCRAASRNFDFKDAIKVLPSQELTSLNTYYHWKRENFKFYIYFLNFVQMDICSFSRQQFKLKKKLHTSRDQIREILNLIHFPSNICWDFTLYKLLLVESKQNTVPLVRTSNNNKGTNAKDKKDFTGEVLIFKSIKEKAPLLDWGYQKRF